MTEKCEAKVEYRVADALSSIDAIEHFIADVDYATFQSDRKTKSAIERELFVVADAMAKLAELDISIPVNLSAEKIRAMDPWSTITGPELKELREALLRMQVGVEPV